MEVPDKWKFERSKKSLREEFASYSVMGGYVVGLVLFAIWVIGILHAQSDTRSPRTFDRACLHPYIHSTAAQLASDTVFRLPDYNAGEQLPDGLCVALCPVLYRRILDSRYSRRICYCIIAYSISASQTIQFFLAVFRPHNKENQGVQRAMWVDGALARLRLCRHSRIHSPG